MVRWQLIPRPVRTTSSSFSIHSHCTIPSPKCANLHGLLGVELESAKTTTRDLPEAHHGHFSTSTMLAILCVSDHPAPVESDRLCHAGHAWTCHHVRHGTLGWQRLQLSYRAAVFLPGSAVGDAVVVVLSSACAPCRCCLPPLHRQPGGREHL